MTNHERDRRFIVRWAGGPLLPEYASNTTLTIATQQRAASERHHGHKCQRYTSDQKRHICTLHRMGMTPTAIAGRMGMPMNTVKHIVRAGAR